jgi:hypothetical protein
MRTSPLAAPPTPSEAHTFCDGAGCALAGPDSAMSNRNVGRSLILMTRRTRSQRLGVLEDCLMSGGS